jgi:hypothetical protein
MLTLKAFIFKLSLLGALFHYALALSISPRADHLKLYMGIREEDDGPVEWENPVKIEFSKAPCDIGQLGDDFNMIKLEDMSEKFAFFFRDYDVAKRFAEIHRNEVEAKGEDFEGIDIRNIPPSDDGVEYFWDKSWRFLVILDPSEVY